MAITFACEGCGKSYTVGDKLAGKTGQCKQCGRRMTIPSESDSEPYGLDLSESAPMPEPSAPLPPRVAPPAASKPKKARPPLFDGPRESRSSGRSFLNIEMGGGVGVVIALALIGLRFYTRVDRLQNRARPDANVQGKAMAPDGGPNVNPLPVPAVNRSGPIRLPRFPDPSPPREIEPGVTVREVRLGPPDPIAGGFPGHCGKLWLYLPTGEHALGSLPCILIVGAGATLYSGMKLGDSDVPEHLPYVRAGYAVLAYEVETDRMQGG
jgi:hypothetical protein